MADTNSIADRVRDLIIKNLEVEKPDAVTASSALQEDLGGDSLDAVELVMALEEEFGIEIPDADAEKLRTVGDVVQYVQDRTAK